jgi:hypothetical protein
MKRKTSSTGGPELHRDFSDHPFHRDENLPSLPLWLHANFEVRVFGGHSFAVEGCGEVLRELTIAYFNPPHRAEDSVCAERLEISIFMTSNALFLQCNKSSLCSSVSLWGLQVGCGECDRRPC